MKRKIAILLVSLLVGVFGPSLSQDRALANTRDEDILPGLLVMELYQLGVQESIPDSLQRLNAQLLGASGARSHFEIEPQHGLKQETRSALGRLAAHAARAVDPTLVPTQPQQPWRTEYSASIGLEVVAVDLSSTAPDRKLEMRLRLWVARDLSTVGRLLWLRRGGPFWKPSSKDASPLGPSHGLNVAPDRSYRTYGVAGYSVPFEQGQPNLVPDLFGLLMGNVLVEIEGDSFFRLPDKEGWFTTGLVEEALVWRILGQVQSNLDDLERPLVQ